jgi:hypothetical protein
MDGGTKQRAVLWLAEWVEAVRNLPDNPFREYLLLSKSRRGARVSGLRRFMLPLILGGAWVVVYFSLIATQLTSPGNDPEVLVWFCLSFFFVLLLISMMQGIFEMVTDCLGLLAQRGRMERHLSIDDMLAVTSLTDKEIVVGTLSVVFPPLARRIVPGAILLVVALLAFHSSSFVRFDGVQFLQALNFAPLSIATLSLGGMFAALILCMIMISLGLEQINPIGATAAAVIHSFAQFNYPLVVLPWLMAMNFEPDMNMGQLSGVDRAALALLAALCHLLYLWFVLLLSARHRLNRAFWVIAAPFALPLVLTVSVISFSIMSLYGFFEEAFLYFMLNVIWAWGSLAIINPLALFGAAGLGINLSSAFDMPTFEFYRFPLQLTLQTGIALLAAFYAEQAVRRRRQALL